MNWMRTEYVFSDHRAVLTLTAKCGYGKILWQAAEAFSNEPDKLVNALKEIVITARPELAGCVIYFMRYNPAWHCWEIGAIHESLPKCHPYAECERIPLHPDGVNMEATA